MTFPLLINLSFKNIKTNKLVNLNRIQKKKKEESSQYYENNIISKVLLQNIHGKYYKNIFIVS